MNWTILAWLLAPLAATRWATLITRDSFGPIRQLREWVEFRWPDDDTVFLDSVVTETTDRSNPDVPEMRTWATPKGVDVFPVAAGEYRAVNPHPLGTLVSCVRCVSVWTGLAATVVAMLVVPSVAVVVFAPFAFSQVAIVFTRTD